ncbi:MAG: LPS export ABC transporter permease LptF [Rhodospirillaceae bacterium]
MGRVQLYIFRQLFWSTVLVAASLTCVVWLMQSLRFVEMIVNRGLSAGAFVTFTILLLPTFLSLIGPIALFAAAAFTYNKMINDSEIVVLRASGMSPARIGRPAVVLAVLLAAVGYLNSLYLVPASYREFKDLQRSFRSEISSLLLQEGVFNPIVSGITVYVREKARDGELFGIIIHDERVPNRPVTVMAERGALVSSATGPRVLMVNGNRQEVGETDGRLSLLYFDRYTFELSGLGETEADLWREPRERYLSELFYPADQSDQIFNYRKLRMEGLQRLTSPLLYPAFVLIALGLLLGGDFNRRGQLYRILLSVLFVVFLQVIYLGAKSMGEKTPHVEPAMYVAPLIAVVAFAVLLTSSRPKRKRRLPATEAGEAA